MLVCCLCLYICGRLLIVCVCVFVRACVCVYARVECVCACMRVLMLVLFYVAGEIDGGALVASVLIKCCNVGRVYFSLLLLLFCAGEIYGLPHYWTIWRATDSSKLVLHITSRVVY